MTPKPVVSSRWSDTSPFKTVGMRMPAPAVRALQAEAKRLNQKPGAIARDVVLCWLEQPRVAP